MPPEILPISYYTMLENNAENIQPLLQQLLSHATPVGKGLKELVVAQNEATGMIQHCAELGIAIYALSWWCHVTPTSQANFGCPHGFGGPLTTDGRLSECDQYPDYEIVQPTRGWPISLQAIAQSCAKQLHSYLEQQLPRESFYRPCLYIGLCLAVPETW